MRLPHAAALALWASRISAVILLAIPETWFLKLMHAKMARFASSHPILPAYHPHETCIACAMVVFSICGLAYVSLVEGLAWCLRKLVGLKALKSGHSQSEIRTADG